MPSESAALQGKTFLIAEDEPLIAMMLEDALREAGARPVLVPTTSQTVDALQEQAFDGLVLDVNLAGGVSWAAAERAAQMGVPVLFSTGSTQLDLPAQLVDAPLLAKPYSMEEALTAMTSILATDGEDPPSA